MTLFALSSLAHCNNISHSGHKYANSSTCLQAAAKAKPQLRRLNVGSSNLRALYNTYDVEHSPEPLFDTNALTAHCVEKAHGFDYRRYFALEEEYARFLKDDWSDLYYHGKEGRAIWMEATLQIDDDNDSYDDCRCDILECCRHHNTCYCSSADSSEEDGHAPTHQSASCLGSDSLTIDVERSLTFHSSMTHSGENDYYALFDDEEDRARWLEANDDSDDEHFCRSIIEYCSRNRTSCFCPCGSDGEDKHVFSQENTSYSGGSSLRAEVEQSTESSSPRVEHDEKNYYDFFDDEECICGILECCGRHDTSCCCSSDEE